MNEEMIRYDVQAAVRAALATQRWMDATPDAASTKAAWDGMKKSPFPTHPALVELPPHF